jgi:histidyl-tRNA synthetase
LNNRKVLAALAEHCGGAEKMMDITIAIDKLDKIGMEKVKEELLERGLSADQVNSIEAYLKIDGSNEEKLAAVEQLLGHIESAQQGLQELRFVLELAGKAQVVCDFTLARGLNYYTGIIFEVRAIGVKMGSIGGGGRYDDLTGLFGVPDLPGVGISFGVDRIYDVLEELGLFPETIAVGTEYIFFNLGEAESRRAFQLMQELRALGKRCELYPENVKLPKQFKYADQKKIPNAIFIGSNELASGTLTIKNLLTGEQREVDDVKKV